MRKLLIATALAATLLGCAVALAASLVNLTFCTETLGSRFADGLGYEDS
jgi:hypothetical protein